jgi:hypothetical protein
MASHLGAGRRAWSVECRAGSVGCGGEQGRDEFEAASFRQVLRSLIDTGIVTIRCLAIAIPASLNLIVAVARYAGVR